MQLVDLAPDRILTNGRIYTLDAEAPQVEALAVKDGRIIATGGADVVALAGPHTEILDLGGRTALPGIFDSHNHLMQVGVKLTRIRLDECTSPAEMMELVRARAAVTPPGTWIIGDDIPPKPGMHIGQRPGNDALEGGTDDLQKIVPEDGDNRE